jgi:hypothetical protein
MLVRNLKASDLGVDGKIILKLILREQVAREWFLYMAQEGTRGMVHGDEPSGSTTCN